MRLLLLLVLLAACTPIKEEIKGTYTVTAVLGCRGYACRVELDNDPDKRIDIHTSIITVGDKIEKVCWGTHDRCEFRLKEPDL